MILHSRHFALVGTACAIASPAFGQAIPASIADSTTKVDEIVVTAQHRSETLEKIPLTMSAISGESLASQGINSVQGLQAVVPSLQLSPQIFGNVQLFIRGVGSSNNTPGGDPAVSFNVDGAYVARTTNITGLLFDLERVEVVKGPQGTLYGRNATGGSVNIITTKPSFEFGGYGAVTFGSYDQLQTEGAINVPLSDTVAARLSFETARHNPYTKVIAGPNGIVGNDRDDQDAAAVRLHLLFKPSSDFSLLLTGDYNHQGGVGGGENILPSRTGDPYTIIAEKVLSQNNNFYDGQLEANYNMGFAKLTFISAYKQSTEDHLYEYPLTYYGGHITSPDKTWSDELRLSGDSEKLKWVAGLYYFYENAGYNTLTQLSPTLFQRTGEAPGSSKPKFITNSYAAFGQATYSFTEALRVTGGLRYTLDEKSIEAATYNETSTGTVTGISSISHASKKWRALTWKAGLEYDIASNILGYANASSGYKSGGFFTGNAPNSFNPEKIRAFEIGLKSRITPAVTLNIASYYYDYRNLQVSGIDSSGGITRSVVRNAGAAKIYGLDADIVYAAGNLGRFDASLAYNHTRFSSFLLPFGDSYTNFGKATVGPVSFAGEQLPFAPLWAVSAGYQHSFKLRDGTLTARVQTHFESGKYLDFHDYSDTYQGPYTKTDLTLTLKPNVGRWSLEAFIHNIEGTAVLVTAFPPVGGTPLVAQVAYAAPRTFGVRADYSF